MLEYVACYDVNHTVRRGGDYDGGEVSEFDRKLIMFKAEDDSRAREMANGEIMSRVSQRYIEPEIKLKLLFSAKILEDYLEEWERKDFTHS